MSRTAEIHADLLDRSYRHTDRMFLYVLLAQWLLAVVLASILMPARVELVLGIGAIINACAISLIVLRPGWWVTRHTVAVVQMLWSAILILITGGRSETHFHVFGSLAFLAFYRDWKVLLTATLVVVVDHVAFWMFWPESVYGAANPEWWRFFEHAAWFGFEDVVLFFGCRRIVVELRDSARAQSELEIVTNAIERKVEARTKALTDAKERYRSLVENIEAVPFEYDLRARTMAYLGPQASRLLYGDLTGDVLFGDAVHADDRTRVRTALEAFALGGATDATIDYRLLDPTRKVVHLRVFLSAHTPTSLHGVAIDITKQTILESELRHAQKLESVGRLAAGVAHEINTPIQFVNDSVQFIQSALVDVMTVVDKHQQTTRRVLDDQPAKELAEAAVATEAAVDLPFLAQSMPEAIDRAVAGIARVTAIVRSIRAFAHPDTSEFQHADLNAAISATLTMARGEYRHVATLETELGELPPVACHVGEINQVVLNLVVNAAHAIGDVVAGTEALGTITVSTRTVEDHVEIAVRDTGAGIPEGVRDHVFDPFFTTKEVGKGTGQGLAIAHAVVVDNHHGKLTFETRSGIGTTFYVTLPIAQPMQEAA